MDLRAAIDANLLASARVLCAATPGGILQEFGSVLAVVTQIPPPGMNGVLGLRRPELHDVVAAIGLVRSHGIEPMVRLDPDTRADVVAAVQDLGFAEVTPNPSMARALGGGIPDRLPIRVEPVVDPDGLAIFCTTMADGFGVDRVAVRRAFQAPLLDVPGQASFVGYAGDEPVGTAALVMSSSPGCTAAGIYSVSVLAPFRRLGYGTALTWAAVALGQRWGADLAVLEASAMGEPVYRALGFVEIVRYRTFVTG